MPLGFYVDEHVSGAITLSLRKRGVNVLTAQDDGFDGRPDEKILDRATNLDRLVVTHDDDYLAIAADRDARGIPYSGVVYLIPHRVTIRIAVDDLELIAGAGGMDEFKNRVTYIPL